MNKLVACVLVALLGAACAQEEEEPPSVGARTKATVYSGGRILTMVGDSPEYVEAVVEESGRIAFVGTKTAAIEAFGPEATLVNLQGKTLLPGFIDAHSHFSFGLNSVMQANLASPPVGEVTDHASLIAALDTFRAGRHVPEGEWLVGWGYDPNGLAERRDITKVELDAAFPDHRVMLIHVSGHGAVLNSKALAWAGIDADTVTPAGGVIARMIGSSEPAGLLMETAYLPVFERIPKPTDSERIERLDAVQQVYASEGYTHAQDGAAHVGEYRLLQEAARRGKLYIDIASLALFTDLTQWFGEEFQFGEYENHLKLQGIKIVQDGSPQGKTAYMTQPYRTGGPGGQSGWKGEPTLPRDQLIELYRSVIGQRLQVFVHVNGDAAIDDLIAAVEAAGLTAADDHRTVAIHSQFQRPDQLPRYRALGITPSYFSSHTFFWGDTHVANQGLERASFISPIASAVREGLVYSNHTDYNVTPTDAGYVLWSAMRRTTRAGEVLGPDQRVDAYTALQGLTSGPAYQLFEEDRKGQLREGLLADFVILDSDPLEIAPDALRALRVLETIKEGKTIFRR